MPSEHNLSIFHSEITAHWSYFMAVIWLPKTKAERLKGCYWRVPSKSALKSCLTDRLFETSCEHLPSNLNIFFCSWCWRMAGYFTLCHWTSFTQLEWPSIKIFGYNTALGPLIFRYHLCTSSNDSRISKQKAICTRSWIDILPRSILWYFT